MENSKRVKKVLYLTPPYSLPKTFSKRLCRGTPTPVLEARSSSWTRTPNLLGIPIRDFADIPTPRTLLTRPHTQGTHLLYSTNDRLGRVGLLVSYCDSGSPCASLRLGHRLQARGVHPSPRSTTVIPLEQSRTPSELTYRNLHIFHPLPQAMSVEVMRTERYGAKAVTVFAEQRESLAFAREIAATKSAQGDAEPFFVMSLARVRDRVRDWKTALPRVQPYYALRCNDDPVLLRLLAQQEGFGLDCASKDQLETALDIVGTERVVYSNPVLTRNVLRHAAKAEVATLFFESEAELQRIAASHPEACLVLRICVRRPRSLDDECDFAASMGCDPFDEAPALLETAYLLGLRVVGIGFNLGAADSADPRDFAIGLGLARSLFATARAFGHEMALVSIGGGFPASYNACSAKPSFAQIAAIVNEALHDHFPLDEFPHLRVVAQPGRFFASVAFTLITNVIGKRVVDAAAVARGHLVSERPGFVYQTNESFYGAFACRLAANCEPQSRPLFDDGVDDEGYFASIIGPALDKFDMIEQSARYRELSVGDWLVWPQMGAYSMGTRGTLGDLDQPQPTVYYFAGHKDWERICSPDQMDFTSDIEEDGDSLCSTDSAIESDSDFFYNWSLN
ncbi:hypothetical protein QR680_008789 [Steinernema hermaphroditum]|uniref:Orn/DAP/Arg decarboxylase 2 N-terminal domain-containing protein n=1 Tax=Steinernema hermaphroditum TaxID=289476 RepID=A0AA39IK86_9BILA|nr:hypothetical protein QR680_008789 [Steinernema hermaphroditum]